MTFQGRGRHHLAIWRLGNDFAFWVERVRLILRCTTATKEHHLSVIIMACTNGSIHGLHGVFFGSRNPMWLLCEGDSRCIRPRLAELHRKVVVRHGGLAA
jgi:hypothetical protein